MKISGSILAIKDDINKIDELINSGIDLLHLDVMDGEFVDNYSLPYDECIKISKISTIPIDIHLMVKSPKTYIDNFINLNPKYITFHVETSDIMDNINYIKGKNILVGLAINPETDINIIIPYLKYIDLVLVMSVHPGYGGQDFIGSSLNRIKLLKEYRNEYKLNYKIEVDGGISSNNIERIDCDIVVIGTAITSTEDYKTEVKEIGELI